MEVKRKLTIEIEGEDIVNLKSGIKKVVKELDRAGLKSHDITQEESELIKKLNDLLK